MADQRGRVNKPGIDLSYLVQWVIADLGVLAVATRRGGLMTWAYVARWGELDGDLAAVGAEHDGDRAAFGVHHA